MFFKFTKEKSINDITLSEYDKIWTKFCFLDESGSLNNKTEPYFTIGILKMSTPFYLQSKIAYERTKSNFHDELKFNKLSKNNINFAKIIIDSIFDTKSLSFYSYTTHKKSKYFIKNFSNDEWMAYEEITLKLLDAVLSKREILILIADHIVTPKEIKYEVNIKKYFNKKNNRLSVAGVCRFDSKSNDLLQVVDLLIGAITYDLKLQNNLVSGSFFKTELVGYLKGKLGVSNFVEGFRNNSFNIFVEKDDGSSDHTKAKQQGSPS